MILEPSDDFEPDGKPKSMFAFAKKRLVGAGAAMTFVVLTTVIASLVDLMTVGFSRVFLDKLLPGLEPGWILPFFAGLSLLTFIELASAWIQAVYSLRLSGKLAAVGNATFMWKVLSLPMEFMRF